MEEKALVPTEPQEMMPTERARAIAKELMAIVNELKWAKNFGGQKDHLEFEAWQFIAAKEGVTASTPETKEIFDQEGNFLGFEARAVLLRNGEILTEATHECTITERNWQNKPRFSLRGMAQTRAMGRVCRNRYAWIARMGGFAGTPADEMGKEFNNTPNPKTTKPAESEPEPPERPESDDTAPIGVHKTLLSQIMKKVVGTNNVEQAKMLILPNLTEEQAMKLVNFLALQKKPIDVDIWNTSRDEILNK